MRVSYLALFRCLIWRGSFSLHLFNLAPSFLLIVSDKSLV